MKVDKLDIKEGNHLSDALAQIKLMIDYEGSLSRQEFYEILKNNELKFTKWEEK